MVTSTCCSLSCPGPLWPRTQRDLAALVQSSSQGCYRAGRPPQGHGRGSAHLQGCHGQGMHRVQPVRRPMPTARPAAVAAFSLQQFSERWPAGLPVGQSSEGQSLPRCRLGIIFVSMGLTDASIYVLEATNKNKHVMTVPVSNSEIEILCESKAASSDLPGATVLGPDAS